MSIFKRLQSNEIYKKSIIESLCSGIPPHFLDNFKQTMLYVIEEKYQIFDREELRGFFYNDEDDELLDLILPSIRRVYGKTFITPPSLFSEETDAERYKLFIMYFNLDEFIDYLVDTLLRTKGILEEFEHIDKTAETLSLIVDNYVAGNVKKVRDCEDINSEIKKFERDSKINHLFND